MYEKAAKICSEILAKISPKARERARIEDLARKLEAKVDSAARKSRVKVKIRVEGSVAKNTWLSGEPDVDVFMRVSATVPRKSLGVVGLEVARKATAGSEQIERFADHPYLEAIVEGTRVNIVPCYDVKQGSWLSATDRTPYHTDYVNKRLDEQMRNEVRLLKKFMKGIGVYGAEIKVGGFSGYLCELLILHYSSFMDTLKTFAEHRQRLVIDIEGYYENRRNEVDLMFSEPLVVVDPVDMARNVASAVRKDRLCNFTAAAQLFTKNPSQSFFYPKKTTPLALSRMRQELKERDSTIVLVAFGKVDAVPDVLWGQLYKSIRSLRMLVELSDFPLLRDFAWSDEKDLNIFGLELEQCCIPEAKKHLGPPLEKEYECTRFLMKYRENPDVIAGPFIEDGRWAVEVRRKFTDACTLLRERLRDGGKDSGVAEQISHVLGNSFEVLMNEEIVEVYGKNREFAEFLTDFLSGKPKWLEAA